MSNNDYILKLLNIEDKNIYIDQNNIENTEIKGKNYLIIRGILTYTPSFCPCCGVVPQNNNDIIKWGFRKNCKIKIPKISNKCSMLFLHKQRYLCNVCNKTFIAETNLVNRNKNISNNTELQIRTELMTKQSEKDISKRLDVSVSKIDRVLNDISCHTIMRHPHLPQYMNWDEFKATKDTKGKMAFMIVDNKKGTIFDINNSRCSKDLEKYFRRYPWYERNKVKLISTDFYSGYIFLANKLFKNADIVIDRFHIVTQVYVALNKARIELCRKSNPNYNKLKNYWKLILKNEDDLTNIKQYSPYFKKEVSQRDIVNYLINSNESFKITYESYQGIIKAIKAKDITKFKNIIYHENKLIHPKMHQAFQLYKDNIKYIENSFKYEINNGIIEGNNNLVKAIKRIAFGYRRYDHFISRIFLIKNNIKG
jgi:transposase